MSLPVGQAAPDFTLRDTDGNEVALDSLKGRKTLIVFIPYPFTGTCEAEMCTIRDNLGALNDLDANVVAITNDTMFSNREWAKQNQFGFPVLSDFWPHGEVTRAYDAFDERVGSSYRVTYVLDADGIIQSVVETESRAVAREFEDYTGALSAIG